MEVLDKNSFNERDGQCLKAKRDALHQQHRALAFLNGEVNAQIDRKIQADQILSDKLDDRNRQCTEVIEVLGKALPAPTKDPRELEGVASEAKDAAEAKSIEVRNRVPDIRAPKQLSTRKEEAARNIDSRPTEGFDPELDDIIHGYLKAEDAESPSARQTLEQEPLSVHDRSPESQPINLGRPKSP